MLVQRLRSDRREEVQSAAREIWTKYSDRLLDLARRQLAPRIRRRESEEDVLQSMYKSFCLRQQRGQYAIGDRNDLWNLLVAITENKAVNVSVRHGRQRRDARREQQEAQGDDREVLAPLVASVEGREPLPEEAAILNLELERRLNLLSPQLRQVVLWKLEGWTNEQIAGRDKMDCAVRTVERKLALIRELWNEDGPVSP
jgi:DNA-directed RNA polymerase specialized sigma24 family protein